MVSLRLHGVTKPNDNFIRCVTVIQMHNTFDNGAAFIGHFVKNNVIPNGNLAFAEYACALELMVPGCPHLQIECVAIASVKHGALTFRRDILLHSRVSERGIIEADFSFRHNAVRGANTIDNGTVACMKSAIEGILRKGDLFIQVFKMTS